MDALPDFRSLAPVSRELVDSYRGQVPNEILDLWQSQGLGTAANGFIKVIDPDRYLELLAGCFPRPNMIPVLATGMGDVIVWDGQHYVDLKYRYGTFQGLTASLEFLPVYLADEELLSHFFEWDPYPDAVQRFGAPGYDECFGFVPLLALGGPNSVDHLEKMRLFEHIQIITQIAGPIAY